MERIVRLRKQDLPRGVNVVRWSDHWIRVTYANGAFFGYNPTGLADGGLRLIWQRKP